jgi:hypothetical protein
MKLAIHEMQRTLLLAERLLPSQLGVCFIALTRALYIDLYFFHSVNDINCYKLDQQKAHTIIF